MYLRSHTTQVRDVQEARRERRADRDEGDTRELNATVGKNAKQKLERACKDSGWINIPTSSQGGTDLSREYFRVFLWCIFDISLNNTPVACDWCRVPFAVEHM